MPDIALVAHTKVTPAGNSGGTSPAITTTGANLIVLATTITAAATASVSDSKSNTWTALTAAAAGVSQKSQIFYCLNPTVGTGHTFTVNNSGGFESMCIAAFSGAKSSSAFDQQNTNAIDVPGGTTIQPGAVTPTVNKSLIVTTFGTAFVDAGAGVSINGGFNVIDYVPLSAGTYFGTALAYLVQNVAAQANPTWTASVSGNSLTATIATFKPGT